MIDLNRRSPRRSVTVALLLRMTASRRCGSSSAATLIAVEQVRPQQLHQAEEAVVLAAVRGAGEEQQRVDPTSLLHFREKTVRERVTHPLVAIEVMRLIHDDEVHGSASSTRSRLPLSCRSVWNEATTAVAVSQKLFLALSSVDE